MQCFLRDAERQQDEGGETIKNWISEIKKLAYDAEDVIEIYAIKISSSSAMTPFYKLRHVHKIGNKILSINSQIADLKRSLQTYGLTATTRDNEESHFVFETRRQLRWSYSHVVEEFIVGLDGDIKKVVEWLLNQDQHCPMVFICGMGGLGKTTLAENVYHYSSIRRHFECFAWAYISQKCIRRDVWEGILLQLTTSPSKEERDEIRNMRDEELAKKLYKVQQEKMCLIILDDIWSNDAWDILSPAFPTKNTKSKIVFTSRNKAISSHVDPKGLLHEPGFLNAEDSWALFQKKAFPTKDDPEFTICNEFERLGRNMVAKCAGLPLAIIVLGGKIKTCRLHDLMRDMGLSKAKEEHFLCVSGRSQQNSNSINDVSSSSNVLLDARKTGGIRRLALFLDQHVDKLIPPNEKVNQHLRSLVYIHDKKCRVESWKLLKAVFESFKLLRVLDLEGVKGSKGQLLPKEVGNLFWLKFLSLKRTYLQIIPSSLEEWVIENQAMSYLYRLSISDCNKLKTVPDGLKFVAGLRELEFRWMPKSFKNRLGIAGEDYHKVQHVPSIVFFH
ncbi:hypothetical protein TSUD_168280 [Trifolium subterraneum]|nr:hypothetical protein TSUD_168280 [Trifolium subterraneum]